MLSANSQYERLYINEKHPVLKEFFQKNKDDFNVLLDLHFELQFRTQKQAIINLIAQIEKGLKEIVYNNWDDSDFLQEAQIDFLFEGTNFSINLSQEITERVRELESFRWVSTEAGIGSGSLDTSNWKKNNLLSLLGYKSGYYGFEHEARKNILDKAYTKSIPKRILPFVEEIDEWGKPNHGIRLKKIADSIASVVRSEKRSVTKNYSLSIFEREADLDYLKKTYYDGFYDFPYPKT